MGAGGAEKKQKSVQGQIFHGLHRLETIRANEPVFSGNANVYTYDVHNDAILCILREIDGEVFFGMFNFSGREQTARMQEKGTFAELFTGADMTLNDPVLPPHGFYWLKRK